MRGSSAIDEFVGYVQLFFELHGWKIVFCFFALYMGQNYIRDALKARSLAIANDPERRRVLDSDRRRVRLHQQRNLSPETWWTNHAHGCRVFSTESCPFVDYELARVFRCNCDTYSFDRNRRSNSLYIRRYHSWKGTPSHIFWSFKVLRPDISDWMINAFVHAEQWFMHHTFFVRNLIDEKNLDRKMLTRIFQMNRVQVE